MTDNKKSKQKSDQSDEKTRARLSKSKVAAALKAASGRPTLAAAKLGVSHATICGWMERHPELRKVREEAQQQLVDVAETRLQMALNAGEQWAIERVLKGKAATHLGYYHHEHTRHGQCEKTEKREEHTHEAVKTQLIERLMDLPKDEFEAMMPLVHKLQSLLGPKSDGET